MVFLSYNSNVKNQSGQTSVEYILLVSVMIMLSFTFFEKVNGYILTNPDSMINKYLNQSQRFFGSDSTGGGIDGNYKTFSLPR
jgi:hypothetical protein